jgi:hypothetical protein
MALMAFCAVFLMAGVSEAASQYQDVMSKWERKGAYTEQGELGRLEVKVVYYSGEYIEALLNEEARKNMWTADELERYKYNLLKTLNLDETIPFMVEFNNNGPSMHMAPFNEQIALWVGKKKLTPVDYDKRFNFKLQGKREGMVHFPKYDEKTGKSNLQGAATIRLTMAGGIHGYLKGEISYLWDVTKDNPQRLYEGKAASRLELDRLIARIRKLSDQKKELEGKVAEIDRELATIQQRVDELQRQ